MQHPILWRLVVPVAAALLVASCTSSADPQPTSTPVAVGDTAEPVWTVRAAAMSQPYVKDGVVVAYLALPEEPDPDTWAADSATMVVVAWDAETGDELWRHDAVPGRITRGDSEVGYAPTVDVTELDGAQVVDYLVGDPDSDGTLVATADLRTGKETRYGPAVWATSRPYSCDLDPWRGVCLRGTFAGEADAHEIQLDLESATLVAVPPDPASPVPDGAERLGAGLFFLDGQLGYADDDLGEVRWTRPYEDVLGPGSSPQGIGGWLRRDDGLLLGVGSVSLETAGEYDAAAVMRTVVLSSETGQTVASVPGMPCSARWSTSYDVLAVCVELGTVTFPGGGSRHLTYTDHRRYAVGIDVRTGKQTWRFPDEGDEAVTDGSGFASPYPYVASAVYLVVRWAGEPRVIDTTTGTVTPLPSGTAFLCDSPWDRAYRATMVTGGANSSSLTFERSVMEVCDIEGMPTEASWPAYFLKAALFDDDDNDGHDEDADHDGKDHDGVYVVAVPGEIAAFRL